MTLKQWLKEHQDDDINEDAMNKLIREEYNELSYGDRCWVVQTDGWIAPWEWTGSDLEITWLQSGLLFKYEGDAMDAATMLRLNH